MSDPNSNDERRRADVRALVELALPIDEALDRLANYPFDYLGEPVKVRSEHVGKAAVEFLSGKITASALTAWANRLEMYDDVRVDGRTEQERDEIFEAIFRLANPELTGCSLEDTAKFVRSITLKDTTSS